MATNSVNRNSFIEKHYVAAFDSAIDVMRPTETSIYDKAKNINNVSRAVFAFSAGGCVVLVELHISSLTLGVNFFEGAPYVLETHPDPNDNKHTYCALVLRRVRLQHVCETNVCTGRSFGNVYALQAHKPDGAGSPRFVRPPLASIRRCSRFE